MISKSENEKYHERKATEWLECFNRIRNESPIYIDLSDHQNAIGFKFFTVGTFGNNPATDILLEFCQKMSEWHTNEMQTYMKTRHDAEQLKATGAILGDQPPGRDNVWEKFEALKQALYEFNAAFSNSGEKTLKH